MRGFDDELGCGVGPDGEEREEGDGDDEAERCERVGNEPLGARGEEAW